MTRQRRRFDPSFKLEVVRMIKEQGLSIAHVSESMRIGQATILRFLIPHLLTMLEAIRNR